MKKVKLLCLSLSALALASCGGIAVNTSLTPSSGDNVSTEPGESTVHSSKAETESTAVSVEKESATQETGSKPEQTSTDSSFTEAEEESQEESMGEESSDGSVSEEAISSEDSAESISSEAPLEEASSSSESTPGDPLDDFLVTEDGEVSRTGEVYTITKAGTYTASGTKVGQIVVDVGDEDDVEINLAGVNLSYGENSPIYIVNANGVDISANKGTENSITDIRSLKEEDEEGQGEGAIYSKCDLKIKGTGSLNVVGNYNNGIHSSDDLTIQKLTLNVSAPNNALKGNDSLTVKSGTITAISSGGDGLKTENSDISSKGNQRGTVEIQDGAVDIYAACDGIDASYDALISGGKTTIHTNKYSSYTGEIVSSSTSTMYLRTTTAHSSSYRYAVYFYDDTDGYSWSNATYKTSMWSGRSTYYYYELERPANYNNFKVYRFSSSQAENSTTNYSSASRGGTINTNYDTVTITVSGTSISTGNWSTYGAQGQGGPGGGGPGGQGNTNKSDVSAKGVKADNQVVISAGTLDITAADDGIHANGDVQLENGNYGVGDVIVSGGNVTVASDDDGLHGDRYLNIEGGKINVTKSYEGLEGNQINISGGESYVKATDDGVNAGSGSLTPLITVSGGYLFSAVPSSGDTDGIDSNGNIVISGGTVITSGPNSSRGMSALDCDGTCKISGSDTTLLVFGGTEVTPSGMSSTTKSATFSSGKAYTISYNGAEFATGTLISSYSSVRSWSSYGSIVSVSAIS